MAVRCNKHSEHYIIELDLSKGEMILQEFGNDYSKISDNLQVMSRRLVLLNPKVSKKNNNLRKGVKKNSTLDKRSMGSVSQPNLHSGLDTQENAYNTIQADVVPAIENKESTIEKDEKIENSNENPKKEDPKCDTK